MVTSESPVSRTRNETALLHGIEGLYETCADREDRSGMRLWTGLIHHLAGELAKPDQRDPRLWKLWNEVGDDLSHSWTLTEMADLAHVSEEHLRRLRRRALGRSPVQHLIYLRMREARHLLSSTDQKVETIGKAVGYANPFTFSNTFMKWIGCRPSAIRGKDKGDESRQ